MKSPITINKILNSGNHELASLITRARALVRYSVWLRAQLPSAMAKNCRVADIQDSTLVISVENAIWATKLRFLTRQLLDQFQNNFSEFKGLKQIKVIVTPAAPENHEKRSNCSNPPSLSAKNASIIQELAQSIANKELQAALLRLASHSQPTKPHVPEK